jgi:hypothetical protein
LSTATLLFGFFAWFVSKIEAKELASLPFAGKYFKR